jgi:hypothetical protein
MIRKLLILFLIFSGIPSKGIEEGKVCLACKSAVKACESLVNEQDQEIQGLKRDVKTLEDRLADQQDTSALPNWLTFSLIFIGGLTVGRIVFGH